MSLDGPVAVTGAGGRLGRAVLAELEERGIGHVGWGRPAYDLDVPRAADRLLDRDRPSLVIHAAAWTDVDGCAREPALADRRNAEAVRELAETCAVTGTSMLLVSTNEVFDGARADGRGYRETDPPGPLAPYGASKLAGEVAARQAFERRGGRLWIVRTAWLFGPPGNDFPTKILAAASRPGSGDALRVVADEVGSPTSAADLAGAILDLVDTAPPGIYHLVNAGIASRFEVAARVLERCRPGTALQPIRSDEFVRASRPPAWAVLDTGRALDAGVVMRPWQEALDAYLAALCAAPPS